MNENQSKFTNPRLSEIFDLDQLPMVTLDVTVADWNALLMAFDQDPDKNFWIPGNFVFRGNIHLPDQTIPNVGLRVRGNSSRNRPEGSEGELHNPINPVWRQPNFCNSE
jgi:spore coat protein H